MLRALTLKAAGVIGNHRQASDWEIKAYAYSIQVVILAVFQYSIYIAISIAAGFFQPTITAIVSSVVFRSFSGTWHLSTFPRCLIYSGLTFAFIVAVALPRWPDLFRYCSALFIAAAGLISVSKWIPAGTRKRINTPHYRMVQKIKTLAFLLSGVVLVTVLEYYHLQNYTQPFIASIGFSIFYTTPWGRRVIESIDRLFDYLNNPE